MKIFYALYAVYRRITRQQTQSSRNWLAWCLAVLLFLSGQETQAQCVPPYMSFHSPVLIEGTDNQIGAVYLFAQVIPGVDAHIKVTDLVGGAVLYNIDDTTGIGYYDAFQPYVVAPANSTSYLDWEITFKVAGTYTDTSLECFAITGVDVDGNGSSLQEFIEAATPGSYALDPNTILNFSFDGVRSKAISLVDNIPMIDTAHKEAMFQMNFKNISTLQYRNGAISNYGADMVRQTCIYFAPFFDSYTLLLPVKLDAFTARSSHNQVMINWSASNENDLKYYILQKSYNGNSWKDLRTLLPGSYGSNQYLVTDAEENTSTVYYRLKQVERTGKPVYSKTLAVQAGAGAAPTISSTTLLTKTVQVQIVSATEDSYYAEIFSLNGRQIKSQQIHIAAGLNSVSIDMPASSVTGLYVLIIKNTRGEMLHHAKFVKN